MLEIKDELYVRIAERLSDGRQISSPRFMNHIRNLRRTTPLLLTKGSLEQEILYLFLHCIGTKQSVLSEQSLNPLT